MDPLGKQPAQPNTQQPPISPSPTPTPPPTPTAAQSPSSPQANNTPPAPSQTPNIAPVPERPVEAWPPAGTPAAEELNKISTQTESPTNIPNNPNQNIAPTEAQALGAEVSEAAQPPVGSVTEPAPAQQSKPVNSGMDGFVSPVAQEIKDSVNSAEANNVETTPAKNPMSDQQADKLFQEEPETKKRNRQKKVKKILISLLVLLAVILIAGGSYIFFFGNKAASDYSNATSNSAYKEAFGQIQSSLSEIPVNSSELQSGLNKLKVAQNNSKQLSSVILGDLNPNYKKAKQAAQSTDSFITKANDYQSKYADSADFLVALSNSLEVITKIEDYGSKDLSTTPAEKISADLSEILKDCTDSSVALTQVTKPGELSEASEELSKALVAICTESIDSIEDGLLALVSGKTGLLSTEDQEKAKLFLSSYASTSTGLVENYKVDIKSLTQFLQDALEQAKTLEQEAQALAI